MTKLCDACQTGNAVIYCRADTAYLCSCCDGKVHGANKLASRHERVLVCEVCEHAPAAVTCKADSAALCITCDNDIHSANPLARRHERIPITPFFDQQQQQRDDEDDHAQQQCSLLPEDKDVEEEESSAAEAASWLLPHPSNKIPAAVMDPDQDKEEDEVGDDDHPEMEGDDEEQHSNFSEGGVSAASENIKTSAIKDSNNFFKSHHHHHQQQQQNFDLFSDMTYLDMDFVSTLGALHHHQHHQSVTDSLVPTEVLGDSSPVASHASDSYDLKPGHNFCAELSISTSSIDVGVVPDAADDISTPHSRAPTTLFDFPLQHHHFQQDQQQQQQQQRPVIATATLHHATPLEPMAREARVLRYREKRKNRKFEKTIRYASRKAYAETRPRIKGRFAKRGEMDVEQLYAVVPDGSFGVVPFF